MKARLLQLVRRAQSAKGLFFGAAVTIGAVAAVLMVAPPASAADVCIDQDIRNCAQTQQPAQTTAPDPTVPRVQLAQAPPGGGEGEEAPVCTTGTGLSGALAWILCPITQLIVDATNFIERNLIIPYLTVSPLRAEADNTVYNLWQNIRNIANIAFIIAFFVVIFSQATSVGLSNYGIKRLLPRLVFVAIGANLSFFVVAFAIDAFNIFGAGIGQLVMAAISQEGGGGGSGPTTAQNLFAVTAVAGGLALATVITSGGAVLGFLVQILFIAFLILLVAVIVLVLRQMIILLLVIVSPLAFVAYLLPNTEKYFTKWRELLIKLLLMYPMIVLLFAVGKIVAALINSGEFDLSGGSGGGAQEGFAQAIKTVMGFFAATVPLIALPATFAAAGGIMGKLYGALQNRGQQAGKAGGKYALDKVKPYAQAAGLRMARSDNRALRGVGRLATRGVRREHKQATREAELKRAQSMYLAQQLEQNPAYRRAVAGVGGKEGAQRALAGAYGTIEKAEREELDNSKALYTHRLRSMGMSDKQFVSALKRYLDNPSNDTAEYDTGKKDASGNAILAPMVDSEGRQFRFSENRHLMQAALNTAADQGEISTLEAARMAGNDMVDQAQLDTVMRVNDGKIKAKGGYHLATNFNLAAGRSLNAPTAAELTSSDPVVQAAAQAQQQNASFEIQKARLADTLAGSTAEDIAGSKQGWLFDVAKSLDPAQAAANPTGPQARLQTWLNDPAQASTKQAIEARLQQIASTPNIRGKAPREAINAIYRGIDPTSTTPLIP